MCKHHYAESNEPYEIGQLKYMCDGSAMFNYIEKCREELGCLY